jgi:hypothetical protein
VARGTSLPINVEIHENKWGGVVPPRFTHRSGRSGQTPTRRMIPTLCFPRFARPEGGAPLPGPPFPSICTVNHPLFPRELGTLAPFVSIWFDDILDPPRYDLTTSSTRLRFSPLIWTPNPCSLRFPSGFQHANSSATQRSSLPNHPLDGTRGSAMGQRMRGTQCSSFILIGHRFLCTDDFDTRRGACPSSTFVYADFDIRCPPTSVYSTRFWGSASLKMRWDFSSAR